ncbi:hypothetical protein SLE2022_268230 [Rubroshorea leprosula]
MMLGEHHRHNPTILVPPWPSLDDPMAEAYSTLKYNAADNNNSPFHLQEALVALQRYLPSNDRDVDSDSEFSGLENPDSPVDAYSCDHFRMYEFKIRKCARGRSHDWTECPYAHPGEKARRRDPRKYHYSGTACPEFRKGNCRKGDSCEFAHGVFECWLHPARYRTQPCKDGPGCRRRVCFFAHSSDQLRIVNSPDSYDDSPTSAKILPFWSSPGSVSPPMSPRAESSPPISPMAQSLSRSLGTASINDVVASLRNIQLGKVKSMPSSWTTHVGSSPPPVFGSPRGPVSRPGFCSLPTTPIATRNPSRSGIGYLDFWDKNCDEEPVMLRVESGRDLRAKMFEKLSKENSLDRVEEGENSGAPDVDWVSDLVR